MLADNRSIVAGQRIQKSLTRVEMDTEIEDPFQDLSDLSNDVNFKPPRVEILIVDVKSDAISSVDPSLRLGPNVLKQEQFSIDNENIKLARRKEFKQKANTFYYEKWYLPL